MIRGNLATRPFYHEGVVHRWLAVAAVLLLAAGVYNVSQYLRYTRTDADLRGQAAADEARAAELRAAAGALRQGQDESQVRMTGVAVREANQLIARRTFSWTELFNHFESALPPDVRITAVRLAGQDGVRRTVAVNVVAQDVNAIDTFMQNLEDTGVFADALSTDEQVNDSGEIEGTIEVLYAPRAAEAGL